jgi:hypothetical protein
MPSTLGREASLDMPYACEGFRSGFESWAQLSFECSALSFSIAPQGCSSLCNDLLLCFDRPLDWNAYADFSGL